jgi:DNA-binding CsgD family transcriptional regulator
MPESARGRGRPPHEPSDETRALVVELVGQDKSLADIAAALGLSEPTVCAHYAEELLAERPQLNFSFLEIERRKRMARKSERLGRPGHVPTRVTRERVEVLVAGGLRQWQIASVLGISVPTLCEHYMPQLENGRARKRAEMLEALFKAGKEGGNVAAQKAWLALPDDMENPPPPPPGKDAPVGKKEQAISDAATAALGTDWANLLPN